MQVRSGALGLAAALLALAGCGEDRPRGGGASASPSASSPASRPAQPGEPAGKSTATPRPSERLAGDGRPRRALLDIPRLGIDDLVVVPYRGFTDDAPGTEIQNRGLAASPYGPRGGTGPGGVGNYQVTAHRLSSTQAFRYLPDLRHGDRVHVDAGGVRYTYRITSTRITSFRSERSLREQRAAVPGRPGVEPARAMITLSTCRTLEDHAEGNYWSDEFDNPEHRVDKIGVLVRTTR